MELDRQARRAVTDLRLQAPAFDVERGLADVHARVRRHRRRRRSASLAAASIVAVAASLAAWSTRPDETQVIRAAPPTCEDASDPVLLTTGSGAEAYSVRRIDPDTLGLMDPAGAVSLVDLGASPTFRAGLLSSTGATTVVWGTLPDRVERVTILNVEGVTVELQLAYLDGGQGTAFLGQLQGDPDLTSLRPLGSADPRACTAPAR